MAALNDLKMKFLIMSYESVEYRRLKIWPQICEGLLP